MALLMTENIFSWHHVVGCVCFFTLLATKYMCPQIFLSSFEARRGPDIQHVLQFDTFFFYCFFFFFFAFFGRLQCQLLAAYHHLLTGVCRKGSFLHQSVMIQCNKIKKINACPCYSYSNMTYHRRGTKKMFHQTERHWINEHVSQ